MSVVYPGAPTCFFAGLLKQGLAAGKQKTDQNVYVLACISEAGVVLAWVNSTHVDRTESKSRN